MNTRAIGAATGVSRITVQRELSATGTNVPVDPDARITGDATGLDGKSRPTKRKRLPRDRQRDALPVEVVCLGGAEHFHPPLCAIARMLGHGPGPKRSGTSGAHKRPAEFVGYLRDEPRTMILLGQRLSHSSPPSPAGHCARPRCSPGNLSASMRANPSCAHERGKGRRGYRPVGRERHSTLGRGVIIPTAFPRGPISVPNPSSM